MVGVVKCGCGLVGMVDLGRVALGKISVCG